MLSRAVVGDALRVYRMQCPTRCPMGPTQATETEPMLVTAVTAISESTEPADLALAHTTQGLEHFVSPPVPASTARRHN